jgi:hypothetical protein
MHQELSWTRGFMLEKAGTVFIGSDIAVIKEQLAAINPGKRL